MRILVCGAGVIGTLFAEKFYHAGNDVTILARGERLVDLRDHGVITTESLTGATSYCRIELTDELAPGDDYDLILAAVRKTQVEGVLAAIVANTKSSNVLLMANSQEDYGAWTRALGTERLLVGCPGATGTITGFRLRYSLMPPWLQKTAIAELDGTVTSRLRRIVSVFQSAQIPTIYCRNMRAWRITHVAVGTALSNSIFMAGSVHLVPLRADVLDIIIEAVREGFRVLEAHKIPITPLRMTAWSSLPKTILRPALRALYETKKFVAVAEHAWAARDELRQLTDELRLLARKANLATPAIDRLASYIDQTVRVSVAA